LEFFGGGEEVGDSDEIIIDRGNVKEVNVEQITSGSGHLDMFGQQFDNGKISTVFGYSGFDHGEFFEYEYRDEQDKLMMRITNEMEPFNGVIEGFAVANIVDNKPIVQIFLDEDWKREVGDTFIWYGVGYKNYKEFNFNEISEGIYSDSIEDDPGRFMAEFTLHLGGVIIGDVSKEKIKNEDEDITLIKFE
jgi:hypothetical protein